MTYLVTGGCGFIGANFIIEHFTHSDEPLINLDKLTYAGNPKNLEHVEKFDDYYFYQGCIGDEDLIHRILDEHEPNKIINFAAESHVDKSISSGEPFFQTNVIGTLKLLEGCRKMWERKKPAFQENFRFLHVSTDEVFGTLEMGDAAFTEHCQYQPNSPYSASKAASDHLVRSFNKTYGLPTLTTNCSNNYGPMQFPEKLIPLVIQRCLNFDDIPIYGDGKQIRDWIFVKDHCDAISKIMKFGAVGEAYNIGGDCELTNITLVKMICEIMDTLKPLQNSQKYAEKIKHVADRLGHDRRYAVDSMKLQSEIGWKPSTDIEKGLRATVEWYLENILWLDNINEGNHQS